ncbi:hypothetical protein ACF1CG_22865 [Streptomyces sp. NPDC014773]|uniref:hypothetical protein n=1 Tax=Streptomyces sp. NPDC014773 TaxID=3364908 RepID=UPI0036F5C3B8
MDIVHAAQTASFSEFLDAYDPSRANAEVKGRSVLVGALTNAAPDARSAIANRLLDAGAGVNVVAEDYGTPLQLLMSQFAYTDETLAPFYDVLFARGRARPDDDRSLREVAVRHGREDEAPAGTQGPDGAAPDRSRHRDSLRGPRGAPTAPPRSPFDERTGALITGLVDAAWS